MNKFITTYTKKHIDPLSPKAEDIDIADIAHALSMMVRANGHFPEFYSVCQHSIHCCEEAIGRGLSKRLCLMCLLHDSSEAYIADIIRPVKGNIPKYYEIERGIQNAVYQKYAGGIPTLDEANTVKEIDDTLLYHEFFHYTGEKTAETEPEIFTEPEFEFVPFREAENKFLALFKILTLK